MFPFLETYSQKRTESKLQLAYKTNSDSLLQDFFREWENENTAFSTINDELYNESVFVFKMFFDPENIYKVSGLSNWDSIYNETKYYILQNKINVHLVKSDSLQKSGIYADSLLENYQIMNFRPGIEQKQQKALYLNEEYETTLYQFLGKPGSSNWRSNNKLKFISPYIKIFPATDNSWFFETRPLVNRIYFNRTKKLARVDFKLFFQEGSAYFIKDRDQWKMIWSGITEY